MEITDLINWKERYKDNPKLLVALEHSIEAFCKRNYYDYEGLERYDIVDEFLEIEYITRGGKVKETTINIDVFLMWAIHYYKIIENGKTNINNQV